LRDIYFSAVGQSKRKVGGQLSRRGQPLDNGSVFSQHGNILLTENGNVQSAVAGECHSIRSLPAGGRIWANHIAEKRARARNAARIDLIPINIAGEGFVGIQTIVGSKSNAVRKLDTGVELLHCTGGHIDSVNPPVVVNAHIIRTDFVVRSKLVDEDARVRQIQKPIGTKAKIVGE